MKRHTQIIATAHVTNRGELLHPDSFPEMVEHIKKHYIHVDIEHDPRRPPVGRVVDARIVTLKDNVPAVEATFEIFENGDEADYIPGGKSLITHGWSTDHLQVQYDENYRDSESLKIITDLSNVLHSGKPQYFSKNSLDALTILTIAGSYALGSIASGFLKQLGSDIYNSFKKQIFRLINEKGKRHKDNLLSFDFNVTHRDKIILVRLLCCNPLEQDIDDIVKAVIPSLDKILTRYFEDSQPVAMVVFEKNGNSFNLLYGVRRDGFPLIPEEPTVMTIIDPTNESNGTSD